MSAARPIRIFAATRDGQAARIARYIAGKFAANGQGVEVSVLPVPEPSATMLRESALIVCVAAVRYGRHLREADALLAHYAQLVRAEAGAAMPPLALASVNLTARKPNRQSAAESPYLRKTIARHGLAPALARAFAGKLDYPRYGWLDRQMIRLIMQLTGGPTDGSSVVEYTKWEDVDAFTAECLRIVGGGSRKILD
jgi:menaquinone-dependent protoporphyrinogen oxidase